MGRKILIIDDERIILELTGLILRSRGFEVLTAENGLAGLEVVARENPPVVLLDYMMPGLDGLSTLRRIRESFPDTYVIMFTGKGSEEVAVELMKAGAADYVLKPFNNQDLLDRIESVFRLREMELANRQLREEKEQLIREIADWNRELERRVQEKSRELESAHAEILQTEKLAALGHLSAGMAHEIRNPLNSIGLFAQVLRASLADDAERRDYIDKILGEVDRIDDILMKLLAASNRPKYALEEVSLAAVSDEVLDSFAVQIAQQNVEVERNYAPDLPTVSADVGEMRQIFSNLVANALQEMPRGGRLALRLDASGGAVRLQITDSGGGIPAEHHHTIFDPFFTTKPKGTGFGLSVVLRIVKTYRGRIAVDSEPGQGATFTVTLPLASPLDPALV